jgi:CubicO group peptidase (beta-lactamase class C family)
MNKRKIRFDRIDKYIRQMVKTDGIPGLSIGLTDRRRTIWTRAYGYSELESRMPVTLDTLFEIGSISKFFSSTVLMQLREEGLIDVSRPVTDYLPWFKVRSRFAPITLHHLLTHTSGLVTGQEESPEGVSEVWALRETETGAAPGEHFHYSNHGYKTLGLVMERVTGEAYGKLITERILRPLGMEASEAVITNDVRRRLAVGYAPFMDDRPFVPRGRLAPATWFESGTADGTICSTPGDMCKHLRMLLNGGEGPRGRLVSKAGFAQLTAPHVKPDDSVHGESYGYGMNVGQIDGRSCLWHTGGMVGFHASIVVDVDAGIGVVTMINGPGVPEDVSFFALKTAKASLDGAKLPTIPPMRSVKDVEGVAGFAGEYTSGSEKLRVVSSGKALWLDRHGRRRRLVPLGPDRFCASKGEDLYPIRFGREKGKVVELLRGDEWFVNSRYRGPKRFPSRIVWQQFVGHYRSYSPWASNFRIVLRKGQLALIGPQGDEEPLLPLKDGSFRIGANPHCPERIRFDMQIGGKAYGAVMSGCRYARTFTP